MGIQPAPEVDPRRRQERRRPHRRTADAWKSRPPEVVFTRPGETVQLRVLAHWKDGTVEDVTQITRFKTNDETVATVSDTGLVSCTGKGDSHVVASYDNGVLPIPVMLPVSDFAGAKFPPVATRTRVDELVVNKLRKVGIVPSELCTDAEFLRRVSLDLTGTLPTPDEVTRFLADASPGKRAAKIEELLKSPGLRGVVDDQALRLHRQQPAHRQRRRQHQPQRRRDLPAVVPVALQAGGRQHALRPDRRRHRPGHQPHVARAELQGLRRRDGLVLPQRPPGRFRRPPDAALLLAAPDDATTPQEKALAFAHTFLGVRLECAQCHKHPFDRWTKKDFEQFTAFFAADRLRPAAGQGEREHARQLQATPGDVRRGGDYQSLIKEIKDKVTHDDPKGTEGRTRRRRSSSSRRSHERRDRPGGSTRASRCRGLRSG